MRYTCVHVHVYNKHVCDQLYKKGGISRSVAKNRLYIEVEVYTLFIVPRRIGYTLRWRFIHYL